MGALKLDSLKIVLLVLCVAVNWASSTQNQLLNVDKDESKNHYRDGNLEPSFEVEPLKEGIRPAALVLRGLISFTTFTAVKSTTTVISTLTSTTTCTTSTAALTACSTSGRRRQSLQIDGFLYNENEGNGDGDGRIFLITGTGAPPPIPKPYPPTVPSIPPFPHYPPTSESPAPSPPAPPGISRPPLPAQPVVAENPIIYGPAIPTTRTPRPPYPTPSSLSPFAETSPRPPLTPSPMPYPPTEPVVADEILLAYTPIPIGPPRPVNPYSLPPLPETPKPSYHPAPYQEPPGISNPPTSPTVAETPLLTYSESDIRSPPAAQHSIPLYQPSAFEYPSASQPALPGIVEPSWLNDRDGLIQDVCSRATGFSTCG